MILIGYVRRSDGLFKVEQYFKGTQNVMGFALSQFVGNCGDHHEEMEKEGNWTFIREIGQVTAAELILHCVTNMDEVEPRKG